MYLYLLKLCTRHKVLVKGRKCITARRKGPWNCNHVSFITLQQDFHSLSKSAISLLDMHYLNKKIPLLGNANLSLTYEDI